MKADKIFRQLRNLDIDLNTAEFKKLKITAPKNNLTSNVIEFLRGHKFMILRVLDYQTLNDIESLKSKYNSILFKNLEYVEVCENVGFPDCEELVDHKMEQITAIELTQIALRIKKVGGQPLEQNVWLNGFSGYSLDEELIKILNKQYEEFNEEK